MRAEKGTVPVDWKTRRQWPLTLKQEKEDGWCPQGHVHKLLGDSFTRAENRRQYKNEAKEKFWGQVLYPRWHMT